MACGIRADEKDDSVNGSSRDAAAAPRVDPTVAGIGFAAVLAVVLWGVFAKGSLDTAASTGLDWTIRNFGWLFVIAADIFLVLAVFIAVSKYGRIRLGEDDDEPEFGTVAWVAMMFSAGMGIGLMFYAVAEPIQHYAEPPPTSGVAARPRRPARRSNARCSTGRCTRGRSTRSQASRSRTRPFDAVAATGSVPRSYRFWAGTRTAPRDRRSTLKDLNSDPMVAASPRRMRPRGLSDAVRATVGDEDDSVDAKTFHRHHGGI